MHTLVGFSESVPAATIQQELAAIPDNHVNVEGDYIYVPTLSSLIAFYALGLTIRNVKISSPYISQVCQEEISPVYAAALPVVPPGPIDKTDSPIQILNSEGISAFAGNSDGANARRETVMVWLADGPISPVNGKIHTIKASGTVVGVAYGYEDVALTLNQVLPVGTYDLVGARVEAAHLIAYRFVFVGGTWRPGGLAVASQTAPEWEKQRNGKLGVWGSFAHTQKPGLQVFGDGTGETIAVYLDLIKR